MVLQNYQNFTEMTSNMVYIVAFGVGLKCPRKIHLSTQCRTPSQIFQATYSSALMMINHFTIAHSYVIFKEFQREKQMASAINIVCSNNKKRKVVLQLLLFKTQIFVNLDDLKLRGSPGGGRLCPSHYCQPPRIQKAIYTSGLCTYVLYYQKLNKYMY